MAVPGNHRNPILDFIFPRNVGPRVFKPHKDPFDDEVLTADQFRLRYRMERASMIELCSILRAQIEPKVATNRAYTALERLCTVVRLYAGGSFQRVNGDAEFCSQPSVSRHLRRVSQALINLGRNLITFSTDHDILEKTSNGFFAIKGK